jgi:quinol monooxygenase YgiN
MGGSHGGTTTLASMVAPESDTELLARDRRAGFVAAVALYPGCATRLGSWRPGAAGVYRPVVPVLILIGEKDDWTPAEPCRKLTEAAQQAGYPVTIKVYPGAYHSFDSSNPVRYVATRVNANAPGGSGATTGGDPQAWTDSIREVVAFFGKHLMHMADACLSLHATFRIDSSPSCTYDTPKALSSEARHPYTSRLGQRSATRAEPSNVCFERARSVDRPNQFVLLEAFRDRAAGAAHVHSAHCQAAMAWMPDAVAAPPEILHVEAPGASWATMAELQPCTAQ